MKRPGRRNPARDRLRRAALLAALLVAPASAWAEEPVSLTDDPVPVIGPNATPPGEAQLSIGFGFERARDGRPRRTGLLELGLEAGVAPGLEFRLNQSGEYGSPARSEGEKAEWGGMTQIGFRTEIAQESGAMPALGLLGQLRAEYGPGPIAHEAEAVLLLGKSLGEGERPFQLYLNLGWTARLDPIPGERPGRYLLAAAAGRAVTTDTALVATYVREQQEQGERDLNLVGAGVRHRLGDGRTEIGFTAAAGLGRDSPAFQLAFAVLWQLGGER